MTPTMTVSPAFGISWNRASDGALVAYITGTDAGSVLATGGGQTTILAPRDFAERYASSNGISYGPGTGDPFASTGYVTVVDDGGRFSGNVYVCRNSGLYLCHFAFTYFSGGACNVEGGIRNATSGFWVAAGSNVSGALIEGCCTCTSIIPCNASDQLEPQLGVGVNVSLRSLGVVTGGVVSNWWVGQIR